MQNKTGIAIGTAVIILVIISITAYLAFPENIGYGEVATITVAAILVAFGAYVIWDKAKNTSKGFPTKDERLENISHKAGYYGFIAAIWTAVGTPMLSDILFDHELEGHLVTATVVIVAGLVFAVSYLYMARKGT
jgi:hypothetical protein